MNYQELLKEFEKWYQEYDNITYGDHVILTEFAVWLQERAKEAE